MNAKQGARALLNLGHTFAHALEAHAGYDDALLHGEAVGAGLALAFAHSARLGVCAQRTRSACAHTLKAPASSPTCALWPARPTIRKICWR